MSEHMDHAKKNDRQQGEGTINLSAGFSRRKFLVAMGGLGAAVASPGLLFSDPQTAAAAINNDVITLDSVADAQTLNMASLTDGQHLIVRSFHPGTTVGGDIFYVDKTRPKSAHNGASIVSTTVPWDGMAASLAAFLSGTGETDPTGTGCLIRLYGESITPYMFGALANGTANDTTAIQTAINFAALLGKGVVIEGVFQITNLRIKNGLVYLSGVNGGGELRADACSGADGDAGIAMVELDGPFFEGEAVSGCTISGLKINGNQQALRGILGSGMTQCVITGNTIYNLYEGSTAELVGIKLHQGCTFNKIIANDVRLPSSLPDDTPMSTVGIQIAGKSVNGYGGFNTGAFIPPTQICSYNLIASNYVEYGTHGIALSAAENNTISDNICKGQMHRSIILSPQGSNNMINANQCLDFDSSGIHIAYGSDSNIITGNKCRSLTSKGEGGVQLYVGTVGNVLTGNEIYCSSNYGIYAAIESTSHTISSNLIVARLVKKAAIAVESDWASPLPPDAAYSRPNYGGPPAPRTAWGISATGQMDISDNTIMEPASEIAAIYLAQLNDAELTEVSIRGNVILGAEPKYYWYFFEQTAGRSMCNHLTGNSASGKNVTRQYYSRGREQFETVANNRPGDGRTAYVVPSGTTEPSAALAEYISLAEYTAATNITDFIGGMEGQEITVRLSEQAAMIHNPAKIRLRDGINLTGLSSDYYMNLRRTSGIWYEVSRSF